MPRSISKPSSRWERAITAIERACQALLAVIIIVVVYRYCWIDPSDPFKCSALLNKGQWLDPGPRWMTPIPYQNWQPPGCMMHEYKMKDIQECFHRRRIVFIGDSTTRQVFWAVAKKMDQAKAHEEILGLDLLDIDQKHKDMEFHSGEVTVQFIWDPWLNSTSLQKELQKFNADPNAAPNEGAGLILLGTPGLWYARHGQDNYFKDFRDSIDAVIPYMDHTSENQSYSPVPRTFSSRGQSPNLLLMAPVQVPRYPSLSPSREETITPEKIDQMNDYLQQASAHSTADIVWSYTLMTWEGRAQYEESGLHVVDSVAYQKADVLLNLRCNANAAAKGYPYDRTCCSNYTQPGGVQWIMIVSGLFLLPVTAFLRRRPGVQFRQFLPSTEVLNSVATFGLVVCFCFYADRTQIFEKSQRQFSSKQFLAASCIVGLGGVLSVRRNKTSTSKNRVPSGPLDHGFLPREQTDEWKGWMQALLLVYHYTHGSKILWLYQVIRLLIASYLFMTGYGHATYFLKTEDYSLQRVASVLIRLNLLSCVLPYIMRTNYLFYYFAPLASFWFLVVYLTLRVGRSKNSNLNFLLTKIMFSAMVTTAFTMIPGILEFVALLLKYTCAISWKVEEWRFRTFLDMYVVYIGMIIAMLYLRSSRISNGLTPRSVIDHIISQTIVYRPLFKTLLIFLSLGLPPGFWALTRRLPDKEDYNWWHPYISFIPVLCFITLRNCHRYLRNYHSTAVAWLGRCSLETYILQYHIWLAGDTKGILRLGMWNRGVEFVIITPIFLWISWCMSDATQNLTSILVGGSGPNRGGPDHQEAEKNSPYLLPKASDEHGKLDEELTPPRSIRFNAGWMEWLARCIGGDLRWRMVLILFVLWLGNAIDR